MPLGLGAKCHPKMRETERFMDLIVAGLSISELGCPVCGPGERGSRILILPLMKEGYPKNRPCAR